MECDSALSVNRRRLLALGLLTAIPAGCWGSALRAAPGADGAALRSLDRFVAGYCSAMNAPGLTLGLTDAEAPIRASSYGYVDLAAKIPVTTAHLFEIGSITKSFVALVILQLREEGKLDLQAPIRSYLPWLAMQTGFGAPSSSNACVVVSWIPPGTSSTASIDRRILTRAPTGNGAGNLTLP